MSESTIEIVLDGVKYVRADQVKHSTVIQLDGTECAYEVGQCYLIRTVTMIELGRVKRITPREIILEDACWVADTGRFSEALATGELNEVEMYQTDVIVSLGAIVSATPWTNDLPTETE